MSWKYGVNEKTIKRDFQTLNEQGRLKRIEALKGDLGKRSQTNFRDGEVQAMLLILMGLSLRQIQKLNDRIFKLQGINYQLEHPH